MCLPLVILLVQVPLEVRSYSMCGHVDSNYWLSPTERELFFSCKLLSLTKNWTRL